MNAGEAIPAEQKRRQGHVLLIAESAPDGRFVSLSIRDNGTGMTEEVKRRAFDMFFTTKPRGLGTGLGLAMVRKVVDHAGGTIEVESTLGKGTSIALLFPVAHRESKEPMTAAIRLRDGRAASLIRNLLEFSGAQTCDAHDDQADLFVMEPTDSNLVEAQIWRKHKPNGRIVLFGRPEDELSQAWSGLEPVIIDDPASLESVRDAISVAMSER